MKNIFITLAVLASLVTTANAEERTLLAPGYVYSSLSKAFPNIGESLGGFSSEIEIKELLCTSSLLGYEITKVLTTCTAESMDGKKYSVEGADLFLTLVNANADLDRASEPATTYILLKNLNCTRIEPKQNEDESVYFDPEYYCTYSN